MIRIGLGKTRQRGKKGLRPTDRRRTQCAKGGRGEEGRSGRSFLLRKFGMDHRNRPRAEKRQSISGSAAVFCWFTVGAGRNARRFSTPDRLCSHGNGGTGETMLAPMVQRIPQKKTLGCCKSFFVLNLGRARPRREQGKEGARNQSSITICR